MKKRIFAFFVSKFLILFIYTTLAFAQGFAPTEEQNQGALKLVNEWMALVDAGEYATAYEHFSDGMKAEMSLLEWEQAIKTQKEETGGVLSRSIEQVSWHPDVNGIRGGLAVSVVTYGQFEKGDKYRQVISLMAEGENEFYVHRTESNFASHETVQQIKGLQASVQGRRFLRAEITEEEWQTYLTEILTLSSWRSYINDGQIVIDSAEPSAIYVFTTPDHFAHPAAVRRQVVSNDGKVNIAMIGYYAGEKSEFDRWWQQFNELNQRLRDSFKTNSN